MKNKLRAGFALLMGALMLSGIVLVTANASPTITTYGTAGDDRIHGNRGPDVIYGLQGSDHIWGGSSGELGTDSPGEFSEYLYGGAGKDFLRSWEEAQDAAYLDGGPGFDQCKISPNDVTVRCEQVIFKDGPSR